MLKTAAPEQSAAPAPGSDEAGATADLSLWGVYRLIWNLVRLPHMMNLVALLLTYRVGFAAADNVAVLKMIERGLPKEQLGLFALVSFPFEMIAPIIVARQLQVGDPMALWNRVFPVRLCLAAGAALIVHAMPTGETLPPTFYAVILVYQLAYELVQNAMFVSLCSFFVQIADARVGATYMTLLNTLANLGGTWPKSVALFLVDALTVRETSGAVMVDGYFVLTAVCLVFGFVSMHAWLRPILRRLAATKPAEWQCRSD